MQTWILPTLLGVVAAAVLGLPLGMLWQAAVTERILQESVTARGATQINEQLNRLKETVAMVVTVVTLVGWASAAGWFGRCYWTRIAQVGAAQHGRAAWFSVGATGLLTSYPAAGYVVWSVWLNSLLSTVTYDAVLANVMFVGLYYCLMYWAISALCTHAIYAPAIPWSTWRT